MGAVADFFKDNWAVIAQAPWVFVTWTVVVSGLVWVVINHLKSNHIGTLEARLKLRDDEITELKRLGNTQSVPTHDPDHEARQARRRTIIADGRRHIAAFNLQARHRSLVGYLACQAEWPAIRAHLDPKVLRDMENGRLAVVTEGNLKDGKVSYLMHELDRLEREWDLV